MQIGGDGKEGRRLLVSEDGAESKDRIVLLPKVSECFTWGFKLEWAALLVGRGMVCLLHNGDVFCCPPH